MKKIPFSPPDISQSEIEEVCEALRSGWITTGPRVKQMEAMLAGYCNTQKAVCLSSATAALELNLRILGVGEGDEVIVPAYTYTASASAAIHVGAKVVFVDSQKDSFEMDYDKMQQAITKRTKAIMPVDIGGFVCDYDKVFQGIENSGCAFEPGSDLQEAMGRIAVTADCAHSFGATRNGKSTGEIADFSAFSFHAVKNLTTAEGGAATWKEINGVDSDELYKMYQLFSLHGQSKDALAKTQCGSWEYDIIGPWYKLNMTDITAAIGLKQLERYPSLLERRKEIIRRYNEGCDSVGVYHLDHTESSGHLYITRVPGIDGEKRNEIIERMAQRGISCNVHYKPLPMMTGYKKLGYDIKDFPNAYNFFSNEITLPLHTKLDDDDVSYVIENYTEIIRDIRGI